MDATGVRYVVQRIGVEKYEICGLSALDRANCSGYFHEPGGVARGGLDGLQRRQTCLNQEFEFVVESLTASGIWAVRSREDGNSGFLHFTYDLQIFREDLLS